MAKKNKISMPQSGGGLVRYYDEAKSKFQIPPTYVIGIIVVVVLLIGLLHRIRPLG